MKVTSEKVKECDTYMFLGYLTGSETVFIRARQVALIFDASSTGAHDAD